MKQGNYVVWTLVVVMLAAGGAFAGGNEITGKCVKVIDGDTLIVKCDKAERTVQIHGIDAPELEQPWGKETRSFVKKMVGGENVQIEVIEGDGDVVDARVTVNGIDMSEMLISRGLAWVPEDSTDEELVDLAERAREMPCGLWTDSSPQPPWDFREARS
ncbi:MAG: thermonuclease family protein [Thermoanaerobaculales bacterium]|nr:thermonuclease family protein [Thermoanaerobaculales bacterium]